MHWQRRKFHICVVCPRQVRRMGRAGQSVGRALMSAIYRFYVMGTLGICRRWSPLHICEFCISRLNQSETPSTAPLGCRGLSTWAIFLLFYWLVHREMEQLGLQLGLKWDAGAGGKSQTLFLNQITFQVTDRQFRGTCFSNDRISQEGGAWSKLEHIFLPKVDYCSWSSGCARGKQAEFVKISVSLHTSPSGIAWLQGRWQKETCQEVPGVWVTIRTPFQILWLGSG